MAAATRATQAATQAATLCTAGRDPMPPGCDPCPRLQPRASRLHDAAVDLFLLARCDVLLVSPMSSFGSFAHGYASSGAPPWKASVTLTSTRTSPAQTSPARTSPALSCPPLTSP